jgi:hypothetical protein
MHFFATIQRIEQHVRSFLRRTPILYALVGGIGVVLFWKGVWEMVAAVPIFDGPVSAVLGAVILTVSGLLVSVFIGDKIITADVESEKRLAERTEGELKVEETTLRHIQDELKHIENDLQHLK